MGPQGRQVRLLDGAGGGPACFQWVGLAREEEETVEVAGSGLIWVKPTPASQLGARLCHPQIIDQGGSQ